MSNLLTHGLSALMEACNMSENSEIENDSLFEAFNNAIDDDIIDALDGNDSVENDMNGNGVVNDKEISKLVDKIPPSDALVKEDIGSLTESLVPYDMIGSVSIESWGLDDNEI